MGLKPCVTVCGVRPLALHPLTYLPICVWEHLEQVHYFPCKSVCSAYVLHSDMPM